MDINDIPIKQDVNPVSDSRTQVSAEEFNSIVDTVKKAVVNKLGTTSRNDELYITHKIAGSTDVLETQIPKATASTPGIMSKDDKDKLDKLTNYPLVSQTINGDSYNVATDEEEGLTIFAPTEAGQEGYILASTGSGAPQWIPQADIKAGDADHARNADNATKASQDSMGRVIPDTYLTKAELGDIGTTAQEAKNIAEQASRGVAAQESTIADIQETIENISAGGGATNAASVTYNSAGGSLTSTNVQNALTEVAGRLDDLDEANSEAVKGNEISGVRHIVNGVEYKTIVPSGETNNMDFVAPIEEGTQGHILQSSGDKNTPPTWADPADFKVGSASSADNAAKLGGVEASKYVKKTDLTEATTSKAGLMSAADKAKLNGIKVMTGASISVNGAQGLVPAPSVSNRSNFLRGDGTWATPTVTKSAINSALGYTPAREVPNTMVWGGILNTAAYATDYAVGTVLKVTTSESLSILKDGSLINSSLASGTNVIVSYESYMSGSSYNSGNVFVIF